ncbi:MAG: hypothetical protein Q4A76_04065 [Porphyromonadaceae bacterium]|nr:hypothetical protein [Porphyromonadaceae bacterium]
MRPLIKKILKKLHLDRYLSAKLVLAMDLMVATAASMLTMVMLGLLMKKEMTISKFVIEWVLLSMVAALISFLIFKTYKAIIRHSTLREVGKFVLAAALKEVVMVAYMLYNFHVQLSTEIIVGTAFVDFLLTLSMLVVVRVIMLALYDVIRCRIIFNNNRKPVLIFGTDEKSIALSYRFTNSDTHDVIGFLDKGERREGMQVANKRVYFYENQQDITKLYKNKDIRAVLFPTREQAIEVQDELLAWLPKEHIKALLAPPLDEMVGGKLPEKAIRSIKIEDLLGREEIKIKWMRSSATSRGKQSW